MNGPSAPAPPIRLFLELDRNDDPRLYDDLMRFNKGPKRVNRLRLLAHDGLMASTQPEVGVSFTLREQGASGQAHSRTAVAAAHLTSHAFDAAGDDGGTP